MSTADAVAREVAWLQTSGDGLPGLLKPTGGPLDTVQAYWPRTPNGRQTSLYLMRHSLQERRFANQRKIWQYRFRAVLWWPIGATTTNAPLWEAEQQALDNTVDLVLARIRGFVGDHTHGGRFLSVAEAPQSGSVDVTFDDPERTANATPAMLRAEISYLADDNDFTA